jgi:polyisoprenoid-binding protein YceI
MRVQFLIGLLALPVVAVAEPARYRLDPAHATVAFLVEHLGFARVLGSFGQVVGSYVFDDETGELSDLSVTVATDSVFSNDEDRDQHLRSNDFLATRNFPTMQFTAASAARVGEREFEVPGRLELLDASQPLTLVARWNKSGDYPIGRNVYAMGVSARAMFKRSEFGMDYGLAEGWVGDDVEIIIEFEARRE